MTVRSQETKDRSRLGDICGLYVRTSDKSIERVARGCMSRVIRRPMFRLPLIRNIILDNAGAGDILPLDPCKIQSAIYWIRDHTTILAEHI